MKVMRISPKFVQIALFASLAFGGGYLHAQDQDGGEEDELTIPMEKQARLSPAEMRAQVDNLLAEMQKMMGRVIELQKVARKQKDVIKLNCVNDKLLQIKQLMNIVESANTDLVEATAGGDESGRYAHFTRITIGHEKVGALRDEAEACVGEELIFLGPTEVTVEEPEIPDDPTREPPFPGDLVEPPGYASPFA